MSEETKPAAQSVAVDGINAHGPMGAAPAMDLSGLLKEARFQAWVESQAPNTEGVNAITYAGEWLERALTTETIIRILANYDAWHVHKFGRSTGLLEQEVR
jgi:hypothetical protein